MEELKIGVKELATQELARANSMYPLFASNHEAYAVIKEELEETRQEIKYAEMYLDEIWRMTKSDYQDEQFVGVLEEGWKTMILAAAESIQTAAMFEKAICTIYERRLANGKKQQGEGSEVPNI